MKKLLFFLLIVTLGSCKASFGLPGKYTSNERELIIYGDGTYYLEEDLSCYSNYYFGICSYSEDSLRFSPNIQGYVERKIRIDSSDCTAKEDCYVEVIRKGYVNDYLWFYLGIWNQDELVKEKNESYFFSPLKLKIVKDTEVDILKIGLKPLHIWSQKSFEMPISMNKNYTIYFNDEMRADTINVNSNKQNNFTHKYKKLKPNKLKLRSKYGKDVYLKR